MPGTAASRLTHGQPSGHGLHWDRLTYLNATAYLNVTPGDG